jgi:hypothetical protein
MWIFNKQPLLTSSFLLVSVLYQTFFSVVVVSHQAFEHDEAASESSPAFNKMLLKGSDNIRELILMTYSEIDNPMAGKHLLVMPGEVS